MDQAGQVGAHLLRGCCLEAQRSDSVSRQLNTLSSALGDCAKSHLASIVQEIATGARLLRELADLSQIHLNRVPLILNPLNVVLPCLSRSLRDIATHCADKSLSRSNRWRLLHCTMVNETGGLSLLRRFDTYNQFFASIRGLLIRSSDFDVIKSEKLSSTIMHLREARGIPSPSIQIEPLGHFDVRDSLDNQSKIHWAERIFSLNLPSRTALVGRQLCSKSFGPHHPWGFLKIPTNSKVLLRRSFNDDQLSLIIYRDAEDQSACLLIRVFEQGIPWFSMRGVHELCIERDRSSLHLKRWSFSEGHSKAWAVLCFTTWEG
ncbi:hypothetical protein CDD82_5381 [Ophiocordyceps australis]|uniref:PH domain-containing protein n=1 Tax=Ophiocordyceps australis TaxID=1399860 RepID=A0A2C5Z317_9HYPO|nr:hypothetical protein CDD82_5381 [Ophiocordyceps australis]